VFINRGVISRPSSVSINSKSFLAVNNKVNYFQIKLSNKYLNSLINDKLNSVLRDTFVTTPIPQLINNENGQSYIRIASKIDTVNYILVVPKALVVTVRIYLRKLSSGDERYLTSINQAGLFEKPLASSHSMCVMRKLSHFVKQEPKVLREDDEEMADDESNSTNDEKSRLTYDLSRLPLLNNLKHCIKLYLVNC
jgi:hypothetical protein